MENIRIKVSSQALLNGAEEVSDTVADLKAGFSEIESAVNRSTGYWQGDAAQAHRAAYQDMKEHVENIFLRLSEHAEDLKKMAGGYTEAEGEAASYVEDLPPDVLL